jgi:signal transduction histidine kinase
MRAGGAIAAEQGLTHAEGLVKDLLRLARLDAGQETLKLASCDARALVQSLVADLSPSRFCSRELRMPTSAPLSPRSTQT